MNKASSPQFISDNNFPISYFEEEVREGFYIPTMMKRYWAGQIKVLGEIDRVCRKHDIQWFATYGTLLGAVRHGGYIPWDDDLDICMMRKDYDRFFEVAVRDLPEEYSAINVKYEQYLTNMIGRVLNNYKLKVVDYSEGHMRASCECPYLLGVDIFPMDNIYEDENKEQDRVRRLHDISLAIDIIKKNVSESDIPDMEGTLAFLLDLIERDNNVKININENTERELLLLSDRIYSEYENDDSAEVALMPLWAGFNCNRFPRALFRDCVKIPFENTEINAPGRYDELLRLAYGDYMVIHRGSGLHGYPVYGTPENMLRERMGGNPYRYTFDKDEYIRIKNEKNNRKNTDDHCMDMVYSIMEAIRSVKTLIQNNMASYAGQLLEACQNLAISIGTLLEERTYGSEAVVKELEIFCEELYVCHEDLAEMDGFDESGYQDEDRQSSKGIKINDLIDHTENLIGQIKEFLDNRRKRILFLPCTARWWDSMRGYYNLESSEYDDIHVIPIPYYIKDENGNAVRIDQAGSFPEDIRMTDVNEYDFTNGYEDEIVVQIPYDEHNTAFRVPDFFFSKNLVRYTDKITYIPYLDADTPKEGDARAIKSLESFIEQPVMIYADSIILDSDGLKTIYVDKLTELSGEEERSFWEKKITVDEQPADRNRLGNDKLLMHYVDISYFLQYGNAAIEKLRRNLNCFYEAGKKLSYVFVSDRRISDLHEVGAAYSDILNEVKEKQGYNVISIEEADKYLKEADAYYGSAGVLAHKLRLKGKPVMVIGAPDI
ncbi:MAG: LicD family protein [Lachnospiraceae bacterium]|nr:LicD family protein [Lachnospiraceae bacterium]